MKAPAQKKEAQVPSVANRKKSFSHKEKVKLTPTPKDCNFQSLKGPRSSNLENMAGKGTKSPAKLAQKRRILCNKMQS